MSSLSAHTEDSAAELGHSGFCAAICYGQSPLHLHVSTSSLAVRDVAHLPTATARRERVRDPMRRPVALSRVVRLAATVRVRGPRRRQHVAPRRPVDDGAQSEAEDVRGIHLAGVGCYARASTFASTSASLSRSLAKESDDCRTTPNDGVTRSRDASHSAYDALASNRLTLALSCVARHARRAVAGRSLSSHSPVSDCRPATLTIASIVGPPRMSGGVLVVNWLRPTSTPRPTSRSTSDNVYRLPGRSLVQWQHVAVFGYGL